MRCDESPMQFESRFRSRGVDLSLVSPDAAFSEMFAFYRDVRPSDCLSFDHDGDMLLYQWGSFDWGEGKYFNLNLTRQFILQGLEEDDDAIFQLGLTFFYELSSELDALRAGDRWCRSPAELPDFEQFVFSSNAYGMGLRLTPAKVELGYEHVG